MVKSQSKTKELSLYFVSVHGILVKDKCFYATFDVGTLLCEVAEYFCATTIFNKVGNRGEAIDAFFRFPFTPFFLSLEEMGPLMEKRGLSERKSFSPAKKERKKENSKLKFSSKQKKAYNNITCTQIRRSKKMS